MQWQDILAEKGWIAGFWPSKFGGHDWTPAQSYIFQEETTYAGAPWLLPFGVNYVGPVIYTYGSEAQKARHLPGIVSNEVFWCQGYSEPNAGSDLAQLSTRADRDGDAYVVNGSKIWTSMAHWADWIFALVRTDSQVKPQRGISFLLIDLRTSGITVRPIQSIEGAHHLNQVFFDNVRVPVENLVGEENAGWGACWTGCGRSRRRKDGRTIRATLNGSTSLRRIFWRWSGQRSGCLTPSWMGRHPVLKPPC